jgi:hypothetical protein
MIPSNAALVEEYWEPLLVLLSEQRRVAGQEPPSERRLEGQPGYSGESPLLLHHHPAPIMATRSMDIPATAILPTVIQAMDTQPTHSPAMDTLVIRVLPVTPIPRPMDIKAALENPATSARLPTDIPAARNIPLTPVRRARNTKPKGDILPILVPVTGILRMTISATALRRTGLLGQNPASNLLAEVGLQLILHYETG